MNTKMIYQFKITLKEIKPPIWRTIQVPKSFTFFELHLAIINSMGWAGYHMHVFELTDPQTQEKVSIGMSNDDLPHFKDGTKLKIAKYFSLSGAGGNKRALYEYDFGDSWDHTVTLEKILPAVRGETYPKCLRGRRACPPEDCGSTYGYYDLLEIISDPEHKEHKERIEWLGMFNGSAQFDPEHFDPKEVNFTSAKEELELFGDMY